MHKSFIKILKDYIVVMHWAYAFVLISYILYHLSIVDHNLWFNLKHDMGEYYLVLWLPIIIYFIGYWTYQLFKKHKYFA